MTKFPKKLAFAMPLLGALPALAQESGGGGDSGAVGDAVSALQDMGTQAAGAIAPMVVAVAVAFAGITLAIVAVRYFRRAAR